MVIPFLVVFQKLNIFPHRFEIEGDRAGLIFRRGGIPNRQKTNDIELLKMLAGKRFLLKLLKDMSLSFWHDGCYR